jgi:predicted dehydrogenase
MRVDQFGELFVAKNGDREWTSIAVDTGRPSGPGDSGFSRGFPYFAPKIVEAIRTGATSINNAATFADGVKVQKVLDAARRSNGSGCVERVG